MGQIVYRDFWSPYSPLYAYFLGIWLKLWYDPKMIVLTMAVMDGVALWVSWHFFRPFQSRGSFLFKALVYLILPGSLVLCIIGAQEDVWMWLFVVLAYLVRERTVRVEWYAVILGIGLLMTKAIFVLILVPIFLLEKQKIRFVDSNGHHWNYFFGNIISVGGNGISCSRWTKPKCCALLMFLAIINPWFFNAIGVGEKFWNWIGLVVSVGLACSCCFSFAKC